MMRKGNCTLGRIPTPLQGGFSFIEILVALSIVMIIMGIAFQNFSVAVKKASLESFLQELASGIHRARGQAMKEGQRAVVATVKAGQLKTDFNGDGSEEYFIIFLDNVTSNSSYDAGETVIESSNWDDVVITQNSFEDCSSILNAKCLTVTSIGIVTEDSFPAAGGDLELRIKFSNISEEFCLVVSAMVASASVGEVKNGICVSR
ncbi:MAG: Tfp pilus assembly protein FimT/FimU [Nitrospinota bacterium]